MSMLGGVIQFELRRTLRRPSFWVATLGVPVFLLGYIGLVGLIGANATTPPKVPDQSTMHIEYQDLSGFIDKTVADKAGWMPASSVETAIGKVRAGTLDAFIQFPKNPVTDKVEIVGQYRGIAGGSAYDAYMRDVWNASIDQRIGDATLVQAMRTNLQSNTVTFDHGGPAPSLMSMLVLVIFPLLMLLFLVLQSNQLLTVTIEEKENRISEMLLVSTSANSLVIGKIISVLITGLIQTAVLVITVILAAVFGGLFNNNAGIGGSPPAPNSTGAVAQALAAGAGTAGVDPARIAVGALTLLAGMVLVTGICVLIGAMVPTQKEANNFFAFVVILHLIPIWALTLLIFQPTSPIVSFLRYFPTSAPLTVMFENTLSTIAPWHGAVVALGILIVGALVVRLGVGVFRTGVVEYDRRLKLREVLRFTRR